MNEWKRYRIDQIGLVVTGKTPTTNVPEFWGGDVPFVTPGDLQTTKKIFSTARNVTTDGMKSVKGATLPAGSICVSCIGVIGYTGITLQECISNQQINSIIVHPEFDRDFVYYLIKNNWQAFKNMEGFSSVVSILNKTTFSEIEFNIPPLPTQRRIAAVLGALDDKIENNRKICKNLEEQAQAIFKEWFVDFGPWGGTMPKDWRMGCLGDVAILMKDSVSPKNMPEFVEHYSLPAYDTNRLPSYEASAAIMSNKFVVHRDSVLFSKLNPSIKRLWDPDVKTNNALSSTEFLVLNPKRSSEKYFLFGVLDSESFYSYASSHAAGTTNSHQRVSPDDVLSFPLNIPDEGIIGKFCLLVTPMREMIKKLILESRTLSSLRDALLPKLMSGEIDVDKVVI